MTRHTTEGMSPPDADEDVSIDLTTESEDEDVCQTVHMKVKNEIIRCLMALEEGVKPDEISDDDLPYSVRWTLDEEADTDD